MEFVSNIKANPGVFGAGIVIGVLVVLVITWMLNKSERYVNTSANLQPGAKALLANKIASDPLSGHEGFKHNKLRAY